MLAGALYGAAIGIETLYRAWRVFVEPIDDILSRYILIQREF